MNNYIYLSITPEALIGSMLPPVEFGQYMATGTKKSNKSQVIFFELDYDQVKTMFNNEYLNSRCISKPDGSPKSSVYLSIYRVLEFIPLTEKMNLPDNRLWRSYNKGKASINGFLDDYAFIIDALISLYQATFDEKWIMQAYRHAEYVLDHFSDESTGMFFYTSDIDPPLVVRSSEYTDNVIPSSNSAMAINLYNLGRFFCKDEWIARAGTMAHNVQKDAITGGPYYANWDILMLMLSYSPHEVVITGDDREEKRKELDRHYLPGLIISGGSEDSSLPLLKDKPASGKTLIYVCRNKTCKMPETNINQVIGQLKG